MDKMEEREAFSIEEFTIVELEDRLELAGRCNNCKPAAEQPAP